MMSEDVQYVESYNNLYSSMTIGDAQSRILCFHDHLIGKDHITCNLQTVCLQKPEPYFAISYTWGSEPKDRIVRCGNLDVRVTNSCREALQAAFRASPPIMHVWIDQLCINQHDDVEKAKQVSQMGKIYKNAAFVISWLGTANIMHGGLHQVGSLGRGFAGLLAPETPEDIVTELELDSEMILNEGIQAIGEVLQRPDKGVNERVFDRRLRDRAFIESRECQNMVAPLFRQWLVFINLFERLYWNRRWIVQEISMSRNMVFMIGDSKLPWSIFERAAFEITELSFWNIIIRAPALIERLENGVIRSHLAAIDCLRRTRRLWQTSKEHGLDPSVLLTQSHNSLVTVPHDYTYALRQMLPEKMPAPMPDYGKPVTEAFLEYTRWIIQSGHGERILSSMPLVLSRRPGFPSWCIDFIPQLTEGFDRSALWPKMSWSLRFAFDEKTFETSPSTLFDIPEKHVALIADTNRCDTQLIRLTCPDAHINELHVAGIILDTISHIFQWSEPTLSPMQLAREGSAFFERYGPFRTDEVHDRLHKGMDAVNAMDAKHKQYNDGEMLLYRLSMIWMCRDMHKKVGVNKKTGEEVSMVEVNIIRLAEWLKDHWMYMRGASTSQPGVSTCNKIGITFQGWPVIVRTETIPGDEIVILNGITKPMAARKIDEHGRRILVGECVVAGIMHGEIKHLGATKDIQNLVLI